MNVVARYLRWLHLQWPVRRVEPLPACDAHGRTAVPGVYIVGDLTGVPLLKFALDSGAAAARRIADELRVSRSPAQVDVDVLIVGGGVAGMSAAVECARLGLRCRVVEAAVPFATVASFPARKPIFTYPTEMIPRGELRVRATVKEDLLAELREQVAWYEIAIVQGRAERIARSRGALVVPLADGPSLRTHRVIVAVGRSGNHRRLGVTGEDLPHVTNRLVDATAHAGRRVVVVGGGDSAVEAATALAEAGADVTLVHRGADLARAKTESVRRVEALAAERRVKLRLDRRVAAITPRGIEVQHGRDTLEQIPADTVFVLIGREPPVALLRRSGLRLRGERSVRAWLGVAAFAAAATTLYAMKAFGLFGDASWNPSVIAGAHHAQMVAESASRDLWYTIVASASNGIGFFIALVYCIAVIAFGADRMRRRRTPYVRAQTLALIAVQCVPLFILPEILLPWLGHQGAWDDGWPRAAADALFPLADYDANGREYWRAYGAILAWPLFIWNVFTGEPLGAWLVISLVQTFVIIPLVVRRWGKGGYCGWLCSCGALAETMGDRHRDKMPHGRAWNRANAIGQVLLLCVFLLLLLRVVAWVTDWPWAASAADAAVARGWKPVVDFALAGALGTGLYFGFSGRVWCRFACPLAALMHLYARFSRFRILADGKKCISCSACTATCHQGIDVMGFASRGAPVEDPQCVRCSACVQVCPAGVLEFGRVGEGGSLIGVDRLLASPGRRAEAAAARARASAGAPS